jgi:hypothetical protein
MMKFKMLWLNTLVFLFEYKILSILHEIKFLYIRF